MRFVVWLALALVLVPGLAGQAVKVLGPLQFSAGQASIALALKSHFGVRIRACRPTVLLSR